jgi:hypothetical protein
MEVTTEYNGSLVAAAMELMIENDKSLVAMAMELMMEIDKSLVAAAMELTTEKRWKTCRRGDEGDYITGKEGGLGGCQLSLCLNIVFHLLIIKLFDCCAKAVVIAEYFQHRPYLHLTG